jgi:antitoxin HicB
MSCLGMAGFSVANGALNGQGVAMKFRVLIEPDEDGVFVAECPVLPGCVSQGKTRAEAVANIRDAIQGYLRSLEKHNEPIPSPVAEEIVEVSV